MLSPQDQSRLSALRSKAIDGSISMEEMKEVIKILRQGRLAAATSAATSKAKKATKSADDMLSELGGL